MAEEMSGEVQAVCPNCEQGFVRMRGWQVFCSKACRMSSHTKLRRLAVKEYRDMLKGRQVPRVD